MNPLVLAVISAIVAHNMKAVEDILHVLALDEPKQAGELIEAIARGNRARTAQDLVSEVVTEPAVTRCLDLRSAGLSYEHWCGLAIEHSGDHRCGDCGDVWNPSAEDDEGFEPHWGRYDGTCPLCVKMREPEGLEAYHG